MSIATLFHSVFDLFYPRRCAQCGRLLRHADPPLCSACVQSLPRTEQSHVLDNTTIELFEDMHSVERAAAFLFFDKGAAVQRLVHLLKYRRRPDIAYYLARLAALEFSETDFFDGIDLIVPIPLHPARERQRGYNQSEYIARAISDVTGIPYDTSCVMRIRNNPQQALMQAKDRERNVQGIFRATRPALFSQSSSPKKTILIVDDLITTGSTIRSCITALNTTMRASYRVFSLGKAR